MFVKKLKAHGYSSIDYAELCKRHSDLYKWSEDQYRGFLTDIGESADKHGVEITQLHGLWATDDKTKAQREESISFFIKEIEGAHYMGCKNVVVHPFLPYGWGSEIDKDKIWDVNIDLFTRLLEHAEKYNVNVLIENGSSKWMGDMYFFMAPDEMLDFVKYFNHPLLHICWDTGHANSMNRDPYLDILALGSELRALHVQDNFGTTDEHIAPFMGTLPLDSLMQGLIASNYKGYFTFESCNILSAAGEWPSPRKVFPLPEAARLASPTPALKQKAIALLYEIGKTILEQYGCFED